MLYYIILYLLYITFNITISQAATKRRPLLNSLHKWKPNLLIHLYLDSIGTPIGRSPKTRHIRYTYYTCMTCTKKIKTISWWVVVVHDFNSSTWKTEASLVYRVLKQLGLHQEILFHKGENKSWLQLAMILTTIDFVFSITNGLYGLMTLTQWKYSWGFILFNKSLSTGKWYLKHKMVPFLFNIAYFFGEWERGLKTITKGMKYKLMITNIFIKPNT